VVVGMVGVDFFGYKTRYPNPEKSNQHQKIGKAETNPRELSVNISES